MRVLVLGTAGVGKQTYIEAVSDLYLRHKHGLDPSNPRARRDGHVRVLRVEDEIERVRDDGSSGKAHHISTFLEQPRQAQVNRWTKATEQCLQQLGDFGKSDDQAAFLLMHATYWRRHMLFQCFSWDLLLRFAPDIVITLIDDSYDVRERINSAESHLVTKSAIDLAAVLQWRSAEVDVGDQVARNLYLSQTALGLKKVPKSVKALFRSEPLRHYVISVKHRPETLYRILFEPKVLVVYASFPITTTRHIPERVENINAFRTRIADSFAVLDPVTIDELRRPRAETPETPSPRWPIGWDIVAPIQDSLGIDEVMQLSHSIAAQVEERDYRLVHSADCVAVYRPYFGRRTNPAHGVESEISRAISEGTSVAIYHPKDDGSVQELSEGIAVLDNMPKPPIFDNFEAFMNHLEAVQKDTSRGRS